MLLPRSLVYRYLGLYVSVAMIETELRKTSRSDVTSFGAYLPPSFSMFTPLGDGH